MALLLLLLAGAAFAAALGLVLLVGAVAGLVWLTATGIGLWRRGRRDAGAARVLLALTFAGAWTALALT